MIESNVIHACYKYGIKKLLFLGSSCIYPKFAPQSLKEGYLLTGPLKENNEAYAVAKIAGIRLCKHYNQQYGTNFKFHEAKVNNDPEVVIWGYWRAF
jgi:GDP-L-fucose synthase